MKLRRTFWTEMASSGLQARTVTHSPLQEFCSGVRICATSKLFKKPPHVKGEIMQCLSFWVGAITRLFFGFCFCNLLLVMPDLLTHKISCSPWGMSRNVIEKSQACLHLIEFWFQGKSLANLYHAVTDTKIMYWAIPWSPNAYRGGMAPSINLVHKNVRERKALSGFWTVSPIIAVKHTCKIRQWKQRMQSQSCTHVNLFSISFMEQASAQILQKGISDYSYCQK